MTLQSRIEDLLGAIPAEIGFSATHLPTGATVAINADALFSTASVFKIPVMVEVYRQAREGRFALDDRMAMQEAQRTPGSGVMQRLKAGLAPTIRDLVMLMTIISDNTATQMLLDLVGAAETTATMRRLGLDNIHVVLGLPALFAHAYAMPLEPVPSHAAMQAAMGERAMDYGSLTFAASPDNTTSSAADMARLAAMIFQGTAGHATDCDDMMTVLLAQQLNDRVPRYLPNRSCAHKTGTFRGIRNDAGVILRGGGDAISFALFTFDRTVFPPDNSRALAERNVLVNDAMAELGQMLWDSPTLA